jgi:hypothetical protein
MIRWGAAAGAHVYRIRVTGSDGRVVSFVRKAGSRSVKLSNVLPFESFKATVTAVGANLLRGRPATGVLKAVRVKRRRAGKHH